MAASRIVASARTWPRAIQACRISFNAASWDSFQSPGIFEVGRQYSGRSGAASQSLPKGQDSQVRVVRAAPRPPARQLPPAKGQPFIGAAAAALGAACVTTAAYDLFSELSNGGGGTGGGSGGDGANGIGASGNGSDGGGPLSEQHKAGWYWRGKAPPPPSDLSSASALCAASLGALAAGVPPSTQPYTVVNYKPWMKQWEVMPTGRLRPALPPWEAGAKDTAAVAAWYERNLEHYKQLCQTEDAYYYADDHPLTLKAKRQLAEQHGEAVVLLGPIAPLPTIKVFHGPGTSVAGFAGWRGIAVRDDYVDAQTIAHELGHVVLRHTTELGHLRVSELRDQEPSLDIHTEVEALQMELLLPARLGHDPVEIVRKRFANVQLLTQGSGRASTEEVVEALQAAYMTDPQALTSTDDVSRTGVSWPNGAKVAQAYCNILPHAIKAYEAAKQGRKMGQAAAAA